MKSALIAAAALFSISSVSLASLPVAQVAAKTPNAVAKAASEMQSKDVRTVVREVENTDGNPCMPEGKSYQVDLEVKMAQGYDHDKNEIIYSWDVVKTIGVDNEGRVMEVCAE